MVFNLQLRIAMKNRSLLIPALALATLFAGCVGVGPSTQRGAVAGGALGAVAGAMLGHNSRGGSFGGAVVGGELGALAGGTIGNSVDHEHGTLYGRTAAYDAARVGRFAPPPTYSPNTADPVPPPPAANATWISGYWLFDGHSYGWFAGHWEVPPPGARVFVAAHWEHRGSVDEYIPSYWQ
jgi:hypothetical protein